MTLPLNVNINLFRVKLGLDDNGNLYAIKRYKKETANLSTLQH